jgi:hypothetical protein
MESQLGFSNKFQKPLGYQQFTSLSSAIQLGVTMPAVGQTAIPARATSASSASRATASDGVTMGRRRHQWECRSRMEPRFPSDMTALQIIQQTAGAIINVNYYS